MKISRFWVNELYKSFYPQILDIPNNFDQRGKLLPSANNGTRSMNFFTTEGEVKIVVKAYSIPKTLKRRIKNSFRLSGARYTKRVAINALERGIFTPEPIACIDLKRPHNYKNSYYISRYWDHDVDLKKIVHGNSSTRINSQEFLGSLTYFIANQHSKGVLHFDLNLSNILARNSERGFEYALIDFDRCRIKNPTKKDRIRSLLSLTPFSEPVVNIGRRYANITGVVNSREFCLKLQVEHKRIWTKRMKRSELSEGNKEILNRNYWHPPNTY